MCELLGISCRTATTIGLSFGELSEHGGNTGPHADGWGAAFVCGRDALIFKEPGSAAESELARFVKDADLRSQLVIAHVRKATKGVKSVANSQPFERELGGRAHLFAHNGHVPRAFDLPLGAFTPKGQTDSEHAFCVLLARLAPLWRGVAPTVAQRFAVVSEFAAELRAFGPANFLYADTELLFVHAHRRPKVNDDDPDEPGLHWLERECAIDAPLAGLHVPDSAAQRVQLVATVPLSDERWRPMAKGELLILKDGETVQH